MESTKLTSSPIFLGASCANMESSVLINDVARLQSYVLTYSFKDSRSLAITGLTKISFSYFILFIIFVFFEISKGRVEYQL